MRRVYSNTKKGQNTNKFPIFVCFNVDSKPLADRLYIMKQVNAQLIIQQ